MIELTFLGTRGEIDVRSRRHRRHSSLLVRQRDARIMIDCGADWLDRLTAIAPTAIVLTHAHPDHAWGLAKGAPCPVYATRDTLESLQSYPIRERRIMPIEKTVAINGVKFAAHRVQHSIRAPAVGYRVSAKAGSLFYLPDVAWLPKAQDVLRGINVYIGDGATMTRSMVRKKGDMLFGHCPVTAQLGWCEKANVRRAILTHCGTEIVGGDARRLNALVRRLGRERDIEVRIACDGDRLILPGRHRGDGMRWIVKDA